MITEADAPKTKSGKPVKRYCPRGHDTWEVGRINTSGTCRECHRHRSRLIEAEKRAEGPQPQYVPALRLYRQRRGFSAAEIAFEAGIDRSLYSKLERGERMASYDQRVSIYRALAVLSARETRASEKDRQRAERLAKAGIR